MTLDTIRWTEMRYLALANLNLAIIASAIVRIHVSAILASPATLLRFLFGVLAFASPGVALINMPVLFARDGRRLFLQFPSGSVLEK